MNTMSWAELKRSWRLENKQDDQEYIKGLREAGASEQEIREILEQLHG